MIPAQRQVIRQNPRRSTAPGYDAARKLLIILLSLCMLVQFATTTAAQSSRKPVRAKAPEFKRDALSGVFFADAASLLKGELPKTQASLTPNATPGSASDGPVVQTANTNDPLAWQKLISPTALEDLIKGSKLRLDKLITTPSAFSGGGFVVARKEFSLQALLFAVIESYSGDVRWKKSAAIARERMARAAANTKVGSVQSYNEAKKRLLDLGDLVNGAQLPGEARADVDWSNLIDRVPLMQLLKWAQRDYVLKQAASESVFNANKEQLQQFAGLIAVLGKAAIQDEMPDATDDDYVGFTKQMIFQAQQVSLAVQTGNADLARQAASRISESCTNCHDDFR